MRTPRTASTNMIRARLAGSIAYYGTPFTNRVRMSGIRPLNQVPGCPASPLIRADGIAHTPASTAV